MLSLGQMMCQCFVLLIDDLWKMIVTLLVNNHVSNFISLGNIFSVFLMIYIFFYALIKCYRLTRAIKIQAFFFSVTNVWNQKQYTCIKRVELSLVEFFHEYTCLFLWVKIVLNRNNVKLNACLKVDLSYMCAQLPLI